MSGLPVVQANGIQDILDPILPLHALFAFVYHRRQVLQMCFPRKRIPLSSPPSLTFRNVKPTWKVVPKKCIHLQINKATQVQLRTSVYCIAVLWAHMTSNNSRIPEKVHRGITQQHKSCKCLTQTNGEMALSPDAEIKEQMLVELL